MSDSKPLLCKLLLDHGPKSMTQVEDAMFLTPHQASSLVSELAAKGVLRRNGNLVEVKDSAKAKMIAEVLLQKVPPKPKAPPLPKLEPELIRKLADSAVIRKDVPLPPIRLGRGYAIHNIPWRFADMLVGHSFEVEVPPGMPPRAIAERLRKDADTWGRLHPPFYAAIRLSEDGKRVGLWREAEAPKKRERKAQ